MQPLSIKIKDFCSHAETSFSFEDFSAALIIGKVKDNDRFSNGAGKSTVFNAIEYVLFNEIHFSSLEKVIRDGCDVCKVELEFLSSVDNNIYKLIRSNSRKTGTDIRLFKKNGEWEDLTQRRISDTEKEIIKIIGFNYKAFCSSVLFNQSGSENNVQKDFGNLPSLTPEKRKSVLREVLQLNVYSNYEKIAKSKLSNIQSEIDKNKIILNTIGDPDEILKSLEQERLLLEDSILKTNLELDKVKLEIQDKKSKLIHLDSTNNSNEFEINALIKKQKDIQLQIKDGQDKVKSLKLKMTNLADEAKKITSTIENGKIELKSLQIKNIDFKKISTDKDIAITLYVGACHNLDKIESDIKDLNKPICDEAICKSCHQNISNEHKHNWHEESKKYIQLLESNKQTLKQNIKTYYTNQNYLSELHSSAIKDLNSINDIENRISYFEKDLVSKRKLYKDYASLFEQNSSNVESNIKELSKILLSIEDLNAKQNTSNITLVLDLTKELNNLSKLESDFNFKLSSMVGKKAIVCHRQEQCALDKEKISNINLEVLKNEKSLLVHSKVVQAFGSNGIPALIINNILDELQQEANTWLFKLRPGLQLQFMVVNDNKKKEQEDTLDILYFIDGAQREYKQLSGAQKIVVSLAIKLSLLFIMNKRLGVNIKLMLLDEVDQALDPGSTEIFAQIIKVIQEEIKVIIITHDDDLKNKFSHAVLVEQNEKNVSFGKLINW